jgi:hypothetical protein
VSAVNGHVHLPDEAAEPAKPFRKEGLGYVFEPTDETGVTRGIRLRADYVKRRGDDFVVELVVESMLPGTNGLIHQAKHNLGSMTSNRDLAKYLSETVTVIPNMAWRTLLLEFGASVLAAERKGQPFLKVGKLPGGTVKQRYLIAPLLALNKFNMLYGPGGAGKGNIAVWTAVAVQAGLGEACGMRVQQANVLYLDWEDDELTLNGRVQAMARGLDIDPPEIHYRACRSDLRSQTEQIARYVATERIGFVIVDSFEMACGVTAEGETYQHRALALLDALRTCGEFTTLLIDHVSEEGRQQTKGIVKPYGSVFKLNEVRWAWMLQKEQAAGSRQLHAGLYHAKYNNAAPLAPIGLQIDFSDEDAVRITREDLRDSEELSKRMSVLDQVMEVLKRGPRPEKELVTLTKAQANTVSQSLSRGKRAGLVAQLPTGEWVRVDARQPEPVTELDGFETVVMTGSDGHEYHDAVPF